MTRPDSTHTHKPLPHIFGARGIRSSVHLSVGGTAELFGALSSSCGGVKVCCPVYGTATPPSLTPFVVRSSHTTSQHLVILNLTLTHADSFLLLCHRLKSFPRISWAVFSDSLVLCLGKNRLVNVETVTYSVFTQFVKAIRTAWVFVTFSDHLVRHIDSFSSSCVRTLRKEIFR